MILVTILLVNFVTSSVFAEKELVEYQPYKASYAIVTADSENSFIIETDKHLYEPGDHVKIEGSIWSGLIAELGGVNLVTVQILDDKDNVVNDKKAKVDGSGNYGADFILANTTKNGEYSINARIEASANLQTSLTLKTQANLLTSEKFLVANPKEFMIKTELNDFDVKIASNSEVSNIQFDQKDNAISFTVSGETGTKGVTELSMPKSLLSGKLNVVIDGQTMPQDDVVKTVDTQDEITLEINYNDSIHTIEVIGTNSVPEFSTSIIILTISIISMFVLSQKNRLI